MGRSSRRAAFAAFVLCVGAGGAAWATRSGDRARAEATLAQLSASPAHARLAREAIAAARRALTRADDARAAGDTAHVPELEALAREHAQTGADLVRAAESERKLRDVQKELSDVETKLTRARALLEEAVARRGRAQAKLDEVERARAIAPTPGPAPAPRPTRPAPPSGAPRPAPAKPPGKARQP